MINTSKPQFAVTMEREETTKTKESVQKNNIVGTNLVDFLLFSDPVICIKVAEL
jgi:hypothetical protein